MIPWLGLPLEGYSSKSTFLEQDPETKDIDLEGTTKVMYQNMNITHTYAIKLQ